MRARNIYVSGSHLVLTANLSVLNIVIITFAYEKQQKDLKFKKFFHHFLYYKLNSS